MVKSMHRIQKQLLLHEALVFCKAALDERNSQYIIIQCNCQSCFIFYLRVYQRCARTIHGDKSSSLKQARKNTCC